MPRRLLATMTFNSHTKIAKYAIGFGALPNLGEASMEIMAHRPES